MFQYSKFIDGTLILVCTPFLDIGYEEMIITYSILLPLIILLVIVERCHITYQFIDLFDIVYRLSIFVFYLEIYLQIYNPILLYLAILSCQITMQEQSKKKIIIITILNIYYLLRIVANDHKILILLIISSIMCVLSIINQFKQDRNLLPELSKTKYTTQEYEYFTKPQISSNRVELCKPEQCEVALQISTSDQQSIFCSNLSLLDVIQDGIVLIDADTLNISFCNKYIMEYFKLTTFSDFEDQLQSFELIDIQVSNNQRFSTQTYVSYRQRLNQYNNLHIQSIVLREQDYVDNNKILQDLKRIKGDQSLRDQLNKKNQLIGSYLVYYYSENDDPKLRVKQLEIIVHSTKIDNKLEIILQLRDVTHREYIKQIRSDNKAKSNTISFVSHEYRSPLNQIIQYLNFAKEKLEHSDAINYINIALNNSRYLLHLSNDLLDFAQIKAGKFNLVITKFNLISLLKECIEMFELTAQAKKIELKLKIELDVPKQIESDPNRIKQVIVNLLGNAFKFTLQGSIELKVIFENEKDLKIQISDTGIGIKEQDQTKLFTTFGKLNNPESQKLNQQGVGLGLVISNSISACLNNNYQGLQFTSSYNQGTNFWFFITTNTENKNSVSDFESESSDSDEEFALRQKEIQKKVTKWRNAMLPIAEEMEQKIENKKPRILIVDDNAFNLEMLELLINKIRTDLQIDKAYNGVDAVFKVKDKKVGQQDYQIILMDIEMPNLNGYEATQIIKDYNINIKIIGCSAYSIKLEQKKSEELGMNGYIEKPIQLPELKKILDQIPQL